MTKETYCNNCNHIKKETEKDWDEIEIRDLKYHLCYECTESLLETFFIKNNKIKGHYHNWIK